MDWLGLHYSIWVVLALYFAAMLGLGWWCKRTIHDREGFLLGNRQFGTWYMVMHAFGAGTHPGDVAGVTSKTVERGASGIWVSWMWMFGTPFYWLIAPVVRRMRCLTMADYFEERFGKAATVLYVIVATVGMTIATASVLLATTRTVQGMMGKATVVKVVNAAEGAGAEAAAGEAAAAEAAKRPAWAARGVKSKREAEAWFFGILFITTAVFVVYSYWGGIVAAIKTDMAQGLMIIALSFIAIPIALAEVKGWGSAKEILTTSAAAGGQALSLFDPKYFSLLAVLVLCINAPFSMMAQPHLMSVTSAGKTEWEGRVGFTYGNVLKRICTMGWCFLALCWLALLIKQGTTVHADAAFGDSVRGLLPPLLQGIMLACVLAAAMSSGDALQVTIAGLFSQNIYRPYVRPGASEEHYVKATRVAGVVIIAASVAVAIAMRESVVKTILDYFKLTATVGVSVVMGILWRRMNSVGVFASTIAAASVFIVTRYVLHLSQAATTGYPLLAGVAFGILGSLAWLLILWLLGRPLEKQGIDKFFTKIYVPIGQEDKLERPLDEVVPADKRLCTAGGLFLVKPSTQSWVGFLVTVVICLALVGIMVLLLG